MIQVKSKRRGLLWVFILLLAIAVGVYFYIANEKFADTATQKPDFAIGAMELLKEFNTNAEAANKKYTDKLLAVEGVVTEIELADTTVNIKFVDTVTASYAIFDFQAADAQKAKAIKVGEDVTIKGFCSGGISSDILQTTAINFKRAAIETKK